MTINTKQAERREVNLESWDDVLAEIDRIESAHNAGTLRNTGNWNAGQVLWHCAAFFRAALDGFPKEANPPWWMKLAGRLIKRNAVAPGEMPPAGFKLPTGLSVFVPPDEVMFERGASDLREAISRVKAGERMTAPSPVFGKMTHEQWTNLQLGHCRLHFSFLHPG